MKKPHRQSPRHYFRFKVEGDGVQSRTIIAKAKVRRARRKVELVLTADHVRQAMKADGVGNTQKCTMAVCAKAHKHAFPHPVEGYIDWQYRTAYVVSRVSKQTGLPSECVVYDHNDVVAKLNDTKGGQQKLLLLEHREPLPVAQATQIAIGLAEAYASPPRGAQLRAAVVAEVFCAHAPLASVSRSFNQLECIVCELLCLPW